MSDDMYLTGETQRTCPICSEPLGFGSVVRFGRLDGEGVVLSCCTNCRAIQHEARFGFEDGIAYYLQLTRVRWPAAEEQAVADDVTQNLEPEGFDRWKRDNGW